MTDPKTNTVKYLIALGHYREATELLGWPPAMTHDHWVRVRATSTKEAMEIVRSVGFDPYGFEYHWESRDYPGSWVVRVK